MVVVRGAARSAAAILLQPAPCCHTPPTALPSPHLLALACLLARRQAVGLNPGHFRAYKLMGSALYALGDFEGAKAALKESLK